MARPRSEDKRAAILAAATRVFAERGLAASPTSAISREAGVAEGTLFTYFATKDELMNALYCAIKAEMAQAVMSDFPVRADAHAQILHFWNRSVDWGAAHRDQCKVVAQLKLSAALTPQSAEAGMRPFAILETIAQENIRSGLIRDYPIAFIGAALGTLSETTMEFMSQDPANAARYREQGFALFWNGIVKR